MNGRVGDDAVADANRVVEAGQRLAALGRLDPEAEPADFDGFLVQVDAVEVVFQNPLVEVEQRAMAAQLVQPVVRPFVGRVQLVEGFDQERAAAAGRVEQPNRRQFVLPGFPELDQRGARGLRQLVEVVDARDRPAPSSAAPLAAFCVLGPQLLEAVAPARRPSACSTM